MDQGIAAVLGAAVGVLGTLGTAVATYGAASRQARDQAKATHAQRLRDERREAYLSFLEGVTHVEKALQMIEPLVVSGDPAGINQLALSDAIGHLQAAETAYTLHYRKVQLAGPAKVAESALQVWEAVASFYTGMRSNATAPLSQENARRILTLAKKVAAADAEFLKQARGILEEPTA
ncbi:hypothetical protein [Streptomyces sp. NPDC052701]|uniref:hypothetical protein n=1 Tax=Streptomyces sp. NPDC052701 TaxID=3155533 RepID=UPI00341BF8A4